MGNRVDLNVNHGLLTMKSEIPKPDTIMILEKLNQPRVFRTANCFQARVRVELM